MTVTIVFRPQAQRDVEAARRWYEDQRPGLGARLFDAIEQTLRRIRTNPEMHPLVHRQVRRAVVHGFPYGLYYQIEGQRLLVVAIMHGRRHPRRWQMRH